MASEVDLEVVERNDPVIVATCKLDGNPVDLTGATVEFVVKPTRAETDVRLYSSEAGEIEVAPQTGDTVGRVIVRLDNADLAVPGTRRFRLDVVQADRRLTYSYGRLRILDV
jgi:hypothetical protein